MVLPQGWELTPLSNVASVQSGIGFPIHYQGEKFGDIGFFKVGDISRAVAKFGGQLKEAQHCVSYEVASELKGKPIPIGATVFAKIGEAIRLNRRAFVVSECLIDNNVMAVKAFEPCSDLFLFRFMQTQDISELARSTTVPSLRKGDIEGLMIPLAPLNEQKRIADKLDAVLARVDACRDRLDRVPAILKRFRQSVLAAATSGKLTEEWREQNPQPSGLAKEEVFARLKLRRENQQEGKKFKEPGSTDMTYWDTEIPPSWSVESVSAYAECLDHLRIPVTREKRSNTKGLYPYYGANGPVDMVDEYLFDEELVLVTEDETFYGREKPIAYRTSGRCWVNNHAHVLRTGDRARADYLCFCLMYYRVLPWLTGTTGRAKLTQGVLNSLPIAVPPQKEQTEIVRRVESLFAYADRLEARYANARTQTERLTPALLAKAFRGELVPQDPNDEPASELLERIRADRVTNATKSHARKSKAKENVI